MPWLFGIDVLNAVHVFCCTLRGQFYGCGEIFLKTLVIINFCHLFVCCIIK